MAKIIIVSRYRLSLILGFIILLFFTSCIELVETITINKDLSGKIEYKIETNELTTLLNNFSGLMDASYENDLEVAISKYVLILEQEDGISNVNYKISKRTGDYGFSFDFENSKKLNCALYHISGNKKGFFSPSYLKVSKKKIKKLNISPWLKKYLEREKIEIPESSITNMVNYRTEYYLPNKIKRISNRKAKINSTSNSASMSYLLTDVINNDVNTGIRIRY